ncbi:beta-glucosidase [Pseudomonas juntendi]|uniref:Beta-glucosidase n=1 Tax=Pseudomonas juntendi TaxID=2666183 RepID=A0A7W2QU19_9PSED|nr:glycoside hydrolase family 3 C-terminal domain-containing protein [Pseudomonas juntendi]NPA17830.1 beta-glucosidase [Gammaproteobacteria bacterium]OAK65222.1 beta-glucosidase [Pseudomonas putida]PPB14378.1 beta-glucosidase [Pseudomonas aeruginosa]MBA6142648.1 beta-glucosidase [Pseudomonas juntendi]MCL8328141.1 glycoside hydrolase family 3 C-terminal domain-containing protein [Pseudomonas juntendi]
MLAEITTLSFAEKVEFTAGADMWSTFASEPFGLRSLRMADGPMGVTGGRVDERDVALLTPCGLSLAASWDADLVRRVGEVIGDEALRMGVQALLAPNLNLMRSPLAGRAFELFGEDPQLIAQLGWAWAQGVQQKGVAAVLKHVVCNDSETDRRSMNVVVDEQALREVYFKPFEYAARRGAWAMLTGYNRVNGQACAEHGQVLRQWLKGDLAWDGLLMSDWFGTQDGIASLNNGLDLEMPGPARHMGVALLNNADRQAVEEARLDDALERLRRLDGRARPAHRHDPSDAATARRLVVLEEAAAAGMVLLRNEGDLLPLSADAKGLLAVIGPNAINPCYQGGTFAKVALADDVITPLEALRSSGRPIAYAQGALADHRIPPITDLELFCQDGQPGLHVEFFAPGASEPCHTEVRHASSLIWFKDMPGIGSLLGLQGVGQVKVTTRFVARESGEHRFYWGGTGHVQLMLGGELLGAFDGAAVDGDIMGKLMQAPHTTASIELQQGQEVIVCLTMEVSRSLAHGLWLGCQEPACNNLLVEAVALAEAAEEVLLVVGETADAGLESVDRATTRLPAAQEQLIRRVCAVNARTTVVLNVAHPVDMECLQDAAAVIVAWYPGQQFGPALASVLFGQREPGGRLPVTFARDEADYPVWSLTPAANGDLAYHEGWWVGYRSFVARDTHPSFSFGYGLGYARFAYTPGAVQGQRVDELEISLSLRNVSARAGKDVVQLYLLEPPAANEPVRLSLKAFAAVFLEPGTERHVRLTLDADAFKRWDSSKGQHVLIPGRYQVQVGHAVDDTLIQHTLVVGPQGEVDVLQN